MGRKRLAGFIAAAGLGLLVVGYGAAFALTGEKVPGDTTVLGVPLGGLSESEARGKLQAGVGDRLDLPVKLEAAGKTYQVKPAEAGLELDVEATVDAAGAGRSWNPVRMWQVVTGGDTVEPVVKVDDAKLKAATDRLAERVNRPATEGTITFDGTTPVKNAKPSAGLTLDTAKTADLIVDGYPSDGRPIALPVTTTEPQAGSDAVDQALRDYAEPAMSGPVRLTVGTKGVDLQPAELAPALTLAAANGGQVIPTLDVAKLAKLFDKRFAGLETPPKDATVRITAGRPTVVPAVDGMVVDRAKVGEAIVSVLPKPAGERTVSVGLAKTPADFTTAEAEALGVKELMGQFTTFFPHARYRNVNIGTAARRINGTMLKPGETFSLNKVVGERTKENGFTEGNIIDGGVFKLDLGGGVSQSATTTYNAAFFAGLKDVEHKAHSVYIDRYPAGREATVAWPSVDLKFLNDSGNGILVETIFKRSTPGKKGALTVRIWGTKVWDITAGASARFNYRAPGLVYSTEPRCQRQYPTSGFDIKIYRYFAKGGQRVKTESYTTKYNPADDIRCGPKPGPKPTVPPTNPTTPGTGVTRPPVKPKPPVTRRPS